MASEELQPVVRELLKTLMEYQVRESVLAADGSSQHLSRRDLCVTDASKGAGRPEISDEEASRNRHAGGEPDFVVQVAGLLGTLTTL